MVLLSSFGYSLSHGCALPIWLPRLFWLTLSSAGSLSISWLTLVPNGSLDIGWLTLPLLGPLTGTWLALAD
jgi:hypothetical protein